MIKGHFGKFGGRYVPEMLIPALEELEKAYLAAKFGFSCTVYMGEVDMARQRPNVFLMERLGATVVPVAFGNKTLKDAVNAALKDWIENVKDTHYLLGSVVGPHPYPTMTADFQSVVGREVKKQLRDYKVLPDYIIACVGGGSNAMGIFSAFLQEKNVSLIGVEAGGKSDKIGEHARRFLGGSVGVVEGYKSYFLQDSDGQIAKTHSIAAGLDYAGIGPQLALLREEKRVAFTSVSDKEAVAAVSLLAKTEGIIPALESAHAVAYAVKLAPTLSKDKVIIINLSGRGDKDLFILAKAIKDEKFMEFLRNYAKA